MNLYQEGHKYISCYVSPDGKLSPMGDAKKKDYAIECAKRHKHVLCRLVILNDYREDYMTNDDKDLKLKECPYQRAHKMQYAYSPNKDLIDNAFNHTNKPRLHEYQDGGYWVYCTCCYAKGPKFPDKNMAIDAWNSTATPKQPSEPLKELDDVRAKLKEFYTDYGSCVTYEERRGCLDHWESEFGQPSEPMKELDEETIRLEVKYQIDLAIEHFLRGHPYNLSEPALNFINERVENILSVAKFGQPSEKKALSVVDIEKAFCQEVMDADEFRAYDFGRFMSYNKQTFWKGFKAIHSALPARKEVKWPEERKSIDCGCGQFENCGCHVSDYNEGRSDAIKAYESAMPAQREVRYPEKRKYQPFTGPESDNIYARQTQGFNEAIDEFKKLNGG